MSVGGRWDSISDFLEWSDGAGSSFFYRGRSGVCIQRFRKGSLNVFIFGAVRLRNLHSLVFFFFAGFRVKLGERALFKWASYPQKK